MTNTFIQNFWDQQAVEYGASHWASWGDQHMIALEIDMVSRHIKDGDKIIDIGCANGYGAFKQYETHALHSLLGVDYAPNMIKAAKDEKAKRGLGANIEFEVADITKLPYANASYDVSYTSRVLINLPTWDEQVEGIKECLRVTKPGGKVILCEGFWEPLMRLNAMRALVNLPPLNEHDFNRYIKMERLKILLDGMGLTYEVNDFSSIYCPSSYKMARISARAKRDFAHLVG